MYYTVNNVKLFVNDEGEGSPTLLFMNCWGGSTETWKQVTAKLKNSFRCITYDITLIIVGENDIVDSPERLSLEVKAIINGSEMVLIEGAGHLSMLQQPEKVAQLIIAFLKAYESRFQVSILNRN